MNETWEQRAPLTLLLHQDQDSTRSTVMLPLNEIPVKERAKQGQARFRYCAFYTYVNKCIILTKHATLIQTKTMGMVQWVKMASYKIHWEK